MNLAARNKNIAERIIEIGKKTQQTAPQVYANSM